MFNPFFRPYVPGFRVGPDGVPGFNIDDSGLRRRATASSDGTLPESAAQRYPDAAQTHSPPSISFGLPGAEGWVLSTPLIGSPGFRVSPQDDVPGFNVGPQDDAPSFNLDENGVQQPETSWSDGLPPGSVAPQDPNTAQTPTPLPGVDDPALPVPPQLPEWLYQLGTMLPPWLPTAFDPRTGRPIAINSLPGSSSAAAPTPTSGRPPARLSSRRTSISAPARSHDAEHQSPTGGAASDADRWAPATEGRLAVCPRGWCPITDTTDPASRRLQLQPCERWRCWRATGAATGAVAALPADATDNAVGSARYWAGDGPPA